MEGLKLIKYSILIILILRHKATDCEITDDSNLELMGHNNVTTIESLNSETNNSQELLSIAEEVELDDHLIAGATILKRILDPNIYDKSVRPKGQNGTISPVKVSVSLFIRNIENLDDEKMEYTLQMTFRESWIDSRLKYSHVHPQVDSLQLTSSENIWIPDIFFSNEKTGSLHELMIPNFFGRVSQNGEIMVSYRITLLLSCPMVLHYYPLDSQSCPLRMASYGYRKTDVDLIWRSDGIGAVEMAKVFNMPRFYLQSHWTTYCTSVTSTGEYGCLELFLEFERAFGYYLIQIYAPCVMLVLVSWVSFWLEPTATEARVSLAVTAILTVVTQTDGINNQVPPASYIKAIDVWTFMIQFMVFAAILQFSYVNYVVHYEWKKIAKSLKESNDHLREMITLDLKDKAEKKAKRIDNICKICFPLVFGLFNFAYWTFYLKAAPPSGIPVPK